MSNKKVVIYISTACSLCRALMKQMDEWNIPFEVRNITESPESKKELHRYGIYGTPATFIEGKETAILGFPKYTLKQQLGIR